MEGSVDDTYVAVFFLNEEGQDTGFLICERSKLTADELVLIKKLHKNEESQKIEDELLENRVLDQGMLYHPDLKSEEFKDFKFRWVDGLLDPLLRVSMIVTAYG